MNIEVIRYRLPVYWACALINDDYTGLCKEECQEIKNFLNIADGYPVDVDWETEGFCHSNDAGTLPGDCVVSVFVKRRYGMIGCSLRSVSRIGIVDITKPPMFVTMPTIRQQKCIADLGKQRRSQGRCFSSICWERRY